MNLGWLLPETARKGGEGSEVTRGLSKILTDGSPHQIPLDGTNQGFGTPLFPTHLA